MYYFYLSPVFQICHQYCRVLLFFNVDAREMLEYNKQGQTFQRGMMGKHLGVKSILGLDVDDMATSHMTNMYWSSDFYRKLACVKQYHSAERSLQYINVNIVQKD